ncbi:MAG: OB-fold domain-containing protein [Dehalococcoidia bacterium]|nr:OB-fold domain-containing protein [Dehalococcoidia bacterium]
MAAIVSYGAYIPKMRMGPGTKNWPNKTQRAITNFDEDAVTMAVAAARECLRGFDKSKVDAVYLASTSLPYSEKQAASLVATAVDLRSDIFTADIAHSLRAGTQALRMALDGVRAGTFTNALVVVTDNRLGQPGSDLEREGGDAAVAFLIDGDAAALKVSSSHSIVNDILDVWRGDGDRMLRSSPEEHFRYEEGYLHAVTTCVSGMLSHTSQQIADFDKVVLYSPDARRRGEAVKRLGITPEQLVEPPAGLGSSGVAHAFLQLIHALETAGPSEKILLVNYGDGADALVLKTTEDLAAVRQDRRSVAAQAEKGVPIADYYDYLRWRDLGPATLNGHRVAAAPHAIYREQDEVIRFHGMRCTSCGMVQYPAQRVCVKCQVKDTNEPISMSQGGGTLFSYSMDYVAATPDVPLLHGVIDFEVGGRAMMMVTDRDLDAVKIGMPLELTFRKFSEADGISTYLWKAAPAR